MDDGREMFNSEQVEHEIVGMFSDDDNEAEDIEQEARRAAHQRRQHRAPTEQEMEEHRGTHLPYRSWCPHCVAGRGPGTQHRKTRAADEKERGVASVAVDYCFLRNAVGGDYVPVVVMEDYDTRLLAAHVVPAKGADLEWVSKQLVRDLERLGH